MIDVDYWLELEDKKFRMSLIQQRLVANLSMESLVKAGLSAEQIESVENLDKDPYLATIRRYAAAVGAIFRHQIVGTFSEEEDEDPS